MPLKSKAQLEWLKKNRPDLVQEFLDSTKNVEKLPERVKTKESPRYRGKDNSSKGKTPQKKR